MNPDSHWEIKGKGAFVNSTANSAKDLEQGVPPNDATVESVEVQPSSTAIRLNGGVGLADTEEDDVSLFADMPDEYKKLRSIERTLIQVSRVVLITIVAFVCTLTNPNLRNKNLYHLKLWKWEVIILVVVFGRLVSGWGIGIILFIIDRNFLLRKRVLYSVYCLKNAIQNCIWLGLSFIAWQCMLVKTVKRITRWEKASLYLTKISICVLMISIVWPLKTLLIEVLVSSFHVRTFFDRIQVYLLNQHVIRALSGSPLQEQHEREQTLQNAKADNEISIDHLRRMNQKNISTWNVNRMINFISTRMLTTLDEDFKHITSENQARSAAQKIFSNVAKPSSEHIKLEDLRRFLSNDDEVVKKIPFFDGVIFKKNLGISERALETWLVNVFRERRALARSLEDTKAAVDNLHHMWSVVVGIIIFMISLLIFEDSTIYLLKLIGTLLALVSFVFGKMCQTILEDLRFLFVVHPFDVGDLCKINGVQMTVKEMYISTTVFLKNDNEQITYYNNVLSTMPIGNFRRSPNMREAIDFSIHASTSPQKVAMMNEKIISYVNNKSEHWHPDPEIIVRDVTDSNRLKRSLWVSHQTNFQDMAERFKRRGILVNEMNKIFKFLNIEYDTIPMEISVESLPALTSDSFSQSSVN